MTKTRKGNQMKTGLSSRQFVQLLITVIVLATVLIAAFLNREKEFSESVPTVQSVPRAQTVEPTSIIRSIALKEKDAVKLVSDVNYPDGAIVSPGIITKTWEIQNSGTNPWTGYTLQRIFGRGEAATLPVVMPGETVQVSVETEVVVKDDLIVYQMANEEGLRFGPVLWLQTGSTTAVPEEPPTKPRVQGNERCVQWEVHPLSVEVKRGGTYAFKVEAKNCGMWTWEDVYLLPVYGNSGILSGSVKVPRTEPGETVTLDVVTKIPPDWGFSYAHNLRELCISQNGQQYCFGEALSTFWLIQEGNE